MNSFTIMEFLSTIVFVVIVVLLMVTISKRLSLLKNKGRKHSGIEFCPRCGASLCSQKSEREWTCPNCKCQKRDMHA